MGIDPGTIRMGVGILDQSGDQLTLVHSGVLKVSNSLDMHFRLSNLFDQLCEISDKFKPDQIAIESVFSNPANLSSASKSSFLIGNTNFYEQNFLSYEYFSLL